MLALSNKPQQSPTTGNNDNGRAARAAAENRLPDAGLQPSTQTTVLRSKNTALALKYLAFA
jgi:hypothetical protein